MNKKILDVSIKEWHSIMQELHVEALKNQGIEARTEVRLKTPGGHKSYRIADIYVPEQNLVIEVQKSKFVPKEFAQRNEDYRGLGLKVVWILNEERWQPDTDANPDLVDESSDIYIKWRDYQRELARPQYIYNSNRYFIVDYWKNNRDIEIYYCLPTINAGMMYRKITDVQEVERVVTPKFASKKHFGSHSYDVKNHNQPKETFRGYEVFTTITTDETVTLDLKRAEAA